MLSGASHWIYSLCSPMYASFIQSSIKQTFNTNNQVATLVPPCFPNIPQWCTR